ncbi:hypothetical protein RSSM_03225 [Rhodopirellula sallentina SM41]|uniref:Uncharacterized protein n=1 Tax=Rhodopirellula sallentina SM41 TaxID=1263870 RepID=M5U225_9BACT|nr:hypothetical protein RSSM_03225 [Rhodopirellula sallentina SM41]
MGSPKTRHKGVVDPPAQIVTLWIQEFLLLVQVSVNIEGNRLD